MTFEELRAEAQKAYKEVLAADEERKNDKTIARLSELYVESYVNEKRRERDAAFREYVISRVEELRELVSSVITEKRNGLDKMLSTPPTSEQLSLLTALQVRGEDISEGELRNLADQFMPNYQAVKALQTISKKMVCILPYLKNAITKHCRQHSTGQRITCRSGFAVCVILPRREICMPLTVCFSVRAGVTLTMIPMRSIYLIKYHDNRKRSPQYAQ